MGAGGNTVATAYEVSYTMKAHAAYLMYQIPNDSGYADVKAEFPDGQKIAHARIKQIYAAFPNDPSREFAVVTNDPSREFATNFERSLPGVARPPKRSPPGVATIPPGSITCVHNFAL